MQLITIDDLLMGRTTLDQLPDDQVVNANTIVPRANELLSHFGQYRACNSGYRSLEDQMRINPHAPKSKHMVCAAIDLEDKDGKLKAFAVNNQALLATIGLWMEAPASTPTWLHVQCLPPGSGHRTFIP